MVKKLILSALACVLAVPGFAVDFYFVSEYSSAQDAVDAAEAAGGGVVRFPCGTTSISTGIVVDSPGVTLEGCGPQGSIIQADFSTGDIVKLGNAAAPYNRCGGVRDLSINSSVQRTGGYAIAVSGCEHGILENLRIHTQGGHGIRFSDGIGVGTLAAIFFVRAIDIEIDGAFTAIHIDGSLERHFSNLWLRGNFTAGSRGIVVTSTGGDWFDDVDVVQFEIGVSLEPPTGKGVRWMNFKNVLADTNTLHGFRYTGAGTIAGISCIRCWSATNGVNGVSKVIDNVNARGFLIQNGDGLTFTDSRVINNGGHGVEVTGVPTDVHISGGIFAGNCIASSCSLGQAHGIVLTGTDGFRILGVRSGASAVTTTHRQGYGIFINSGCSNYIVKDNDSRGNVTGGVVNVPGAAASRIVKDNL